jgi:hypothetical protein
VCGSCRQVQTVTVTSRWLTIAIAQGVLAERHRAQIPCPKPAYVCRYTVGQRRLVLSCFWKTSGASKHYITLYVPSRAESAFKRTTIRLRHAQLLAQFVVSVCSRVWERLGLYC